MSAWIAGGAMVLGAGLSYAGSRQNAKAIDKANAANQAANDEAQRVNWSQYLLQMGIRPRGQVQLGEIPTDYDVVNTRLPYWATVKVPTGESFGGATGISAVRKGSAPTRSGPPPSSGSVVRRKSSIPA